jgi:hypothetical protein
MWPKLFWLGTSSMPRSAQAWSSARISRGVNGEAARQTRSCAAYAKLCSV